MRLRGLKLNAYGGSANRASWTPARITTALWLDANDATTITLNGSTVSQWNDKSGNGRNFSKATASLQPVYNATGWGTLPAIVFDGIDDELDAASNWTANAWSWYFVFQRTGATPTTQLLMGSPTTSDILPIGVSGGTGNFNVFRVNTVADPAGLSAFVNGTVIKNKSATPLIDRGQSFTQMGVKSIWAMCGVDAFSSAPKIARAGLSSFVFNGLLAEIVVVPNDSTTTERQLLEGYLAWKWGGM